jgi:hypothetical protein
MICSLEALRVDRVDIFSSARARREPTAPCHNLQSADRGVLAGRTRENGLDLFASSAGIRATPGVLMVPLDSEFRWTSAASRRQLPSTSACSG